MSLDSDKLSLENKNLVVIHSLAVVPGDFLLLHPVLDHRRGAAISRNQEIAPTLINPTCMHLLNGLILEVALETHLGNVTTIMLPRDQLAKHHIALQMIR